MCSCGDPLCRYETYAGSWTGYIEPECSCDVTGVCEACNAKRADFKPQSNGSATDDAPRTSVPGET